MFDDIHQLQHIAEILDSHDLDGWSTKCFGTGLPGPLLSFAKKIAILPIFKDSETGENKFSIYISKLFNGTLLAKRDSKGNIIRESVKPFDFRAELGVFYELGRQSIPVILNECIIRGFYFIRQLVIEVELKQVKKINDIKYIEWKLLGITAYATLALPNGWSLVNYPIALVLEVTMEGVLFAPTASVITAWWLINKENSMKN